METYVHDMFRVKCAITQIRKWWNEPTMPMRSEWPSRQLELLEAVSSTEADSDASRLDSDEMRLNGSTFVRAFILELVLLGRSTVRPESSRDRRAFFRIYKLLDERTEQARLTLGPDSLEYRDLVRLRNTLKPTTNGAFDGIEHLLRDQQVWLTSYPNPYYEEISFEIAQDRAKSMARKIPKNVHALAHEAAQLFDTE